MPRPAIIIDCDPGHDDAAAILYAARHLSIAAITTVFGKNALEATTRNALSILALGGLDIPVHVGSDRPLFGPLAPHADLHGVTGLDGAVLPEPAAAPHPVPAVDAILHHARSGPIGIVALGPLTNLAHALRRDASLASSIA